MRKLFFALFTVFIITPFMSQGKPSEKQNGPFREMNLTEDQKKAFKEIHQAHKKSAEALAEKIQNAREEFEKAITSKDASDEEIRKKDQELRALQSQMKDLRIEKQLKIRALLTPEQRIHLNNGKNKLKDNIKKRIQMRKSNWDEEDFGGND